MSRPTIRPGIDHGLLSPSGRMSKRAKDAAIKRESAKLFPPGFWDHQKSEESAKAERVQTLRAAAKNLRDLAARGMSVRRFTKEADRLEAEASKLESEI